MQWYVYPLAAFAIVFLCHIAAELVGRPMQSVLRLRRKALHRMLFFERIALPKARELATSSQAIHEYHVAVRNVQEAQRIFHELGTRLLAFGENEPTPRILLNFLGLNVVQAGHALVNLSHAFAMAKIDSDAIRHAIGEALHASSVALGAYRPHSHNGLIKIRLEPMYLRETRHARNRRGPGLPPVVSRHAARNPRQGDAIRQAHGKLALNTPGRMHASSAASS